MAWSSKYRHDSIYMYFRTEYSTKTCTTLPHFKQLHGLHIFHPFLSFLKLQSPLLDHNKQKVRLNFFGWALREVQLSREKLRKMEEVQNMGKHEFTGIFKKVCMKAELTLKIYCKMHNPLKVVFKFTRTFKCHYKNSFNFAWSSFLIPCIFKGSWHFIHTQFVWQLKIILLLKNTYSCYSVQVSNNPLNTL